jgi:hypothetical protein
MASTYTPIATTTLGSSQATITFSSIPSTYTDLVLVLAGKATTGLGGLNIHYNGETGGSDGKYSYTRLQGNGTTASSSRATTDPAIGYIAQDSMQIIININNYSNTTTYKTALSRTNSMYSSDARTGSYVSLWRDTAAINQIALDGSSNFLSGTVATLYGIKAA